MEDQNLNSNAWPQWQKILFRLFTLFALFYIIPFPIGSIPGLKIIAPLFGKIWDVIVPWTGEHILSLSNPITIKPNGSGDTTWNYVQMFLMWIFALIGTVIWTIIDYKRPSYKVVLKWLTIYIRYYVAYCILSYGFYKVVKLQFPFPHLDLLVRPFGETSPMGLAWKFMGYSESYNFFTGMGEVVGGLLLLWRRTTTFGAIVLACVMSNVVMINYSYDVPVKLFSSTLLLFICFLLLLDAKRLGQFFFLNQKTEALNFTPHFKKRELHVAGRVLKYVLIIAALSSNIVQSQKMKKIYGSAAPKPVLYGIYDVQEFTKNGKVIPANLDAKDRWKRLIISRKDYATIYDMREGRKGRTFMPDTSQLTILHHSRQDTTLKEEFSYSMGKDSTLVLEGMYNKDTLKVVLKRFDENNYILVSRGFNWINEYPFSR